MKRRIPRWFRVLIAIPLVVILLMVTLQASLIYYPRSYESPDYHAALAEVERLQFDFNGKEQSAFATGDLDRPVKVWWLFGGNGSLALDWLGLLPEKSDGVAWILFDYPGYGLSKGRPGPGRIQGSIDDLIPVAGERLGLSNEELVSRTSVMGHSLGASVALKTAETYGLEEVVMISPFTSMLEMARGVVGPVLCHLLTHRYDNRKALSEWLYSQGLNGRKQLQIYHGDSDDLIPIQMSRELSELSGGVAVLQEVPGAGHNDILRVLRAELQAILTEASDSET